jgi:hypothetical protein
MLYSGTKSWSYLPNGYGKAKASSKKPKPCWVISMISSLSRCSTSDWRQKTPSGISPCAP